MLIAPVTIEIIDSRDDNKLTYILVNNSCKVPILKTKLNDLCYIMRVVGNTCHIELDTTECEETKI
jgi:hypothetical protein